MNTDKPIIWSVFIIIIIIILIIIIIQAYITRASLIMWSHSHYPKCSSDITDECNKLITITSMPIDVNRPHIDNIFDKDALRYAIQLTAIFQHYTMNMKKRDIHKLKLPGIRNMPKYIYEHCNIPIALIWITDDKMNAIVSIRGTKTITNLIADYSYNYYNNSPRDNTELVHKGIDIIYMSIKNDLFNTLPDTIKTIFITGHSMGAGIANLFAYDTAMKGIKTEVHGIAPIRIGNKKFTTDLARIARTSSLINMADVVPPGLWSFLPNRTAPYTPVCLTHVEPIVVFNNLKKDLLACHMPIAYMEGLELNPVIVPSMN